MATSLCKNNCGRYAQERRLCRTCSKLPEFNEHMEHVDRRQAALDAVEAEALAKLPRRQPRVAPNRTIEHRGKLFEVVWDGT